MKIFVLLIVISAIAGWAWLLLRKKDKPDLSTSYLNNVQPSGVILVKGEEYLVEQKNRYTGGEEESFELKLTGDGGITFWLNWQQNGGLIATITKEISFEKLKLTSTDLEIFDTQHTGEFDFDNVVYHVIDSGENQLHENCRPNGKSFYYWDFADEEQEHAINIQYWNENTYEASIGRYIRESDIEIYSTSDNS